MNSNTGQSDDSLQPAALLHTLRVGPTVPVDTWRLSLAPRPACFLLLDADDAPILLATTANLRSALTQRLSAPHSSDGESPAPSPRIDYQNLIHSVRYLPVYSRFEADLVYLHNAHEYFEPSFAQLSERFGAHWLHIDMADAHPRFVSVDRPLAPAGTCFGPLANSKVARLHIQTLQDLFDLCRKHPLLLQTPHAKPCDYKAMGRCTAPCDGTIPFSNYRQQLQNAIGFLTEPQDNWRQYQTRRMKHAAAEQNFEVAQQAKQKLKRADSLNPAPPALTDFQGVLLAQGPTLPATDTTAKTQSLRVFAFTPGRVEYLTDIHTPPSAENLGAVADQLHTFHTTVQADASTPPALGHKLTALLAWHTLYGQAQHRVFLPVKQTAESLQQAIDAFVTQQQKPAKPTAGFIDNDSTGNV